MKKLILGALLIGLFSSNLFAKNAEMVCWAKKSSSGTIYYKCYGPVQRLMTGYTDRHEAFDLAGCKNPNAELSSWKNWVKGNKYMWYTCYGTELESSHNSPSKIRNWFDRQ